MKWVGWIVVVVLGLAGTALGVDFYARSRIVDEVTNQVAEATDVTPTVEVGGLLVLPQLASGSLDDVVVGLGTASAAGMDIEDVSVTARGVSIDSPHVAQDLIVEGTIPHDEVASRVTDAVGIDADVTLGDGTISLSGSLLGAGWTITFAPSVVDDGLLLTPTDAELGDRGFDLSQLADIAASLGQEIVVPIDLPDHFSLTSVDVTPDGVVTRVEAANITLDSSLLG